MIDNVMKYRCAHTNAEEGEPGGVGFVHELVALNDAHEPDTDDQPPQVEGKLPSQVPIQVLPH